MEDCVDLPLPTKEVVSVLLGIPVPDSYVPNAEGDVSVFFDKMMQLTTHLLEFAIPFSKMVPYVPIPIDGPERLFPFVVAMKTNFGSDPDAEMCRVSPSPVHGSGVFATKDVEAGTILTGYPIHAIRISSSNYLLTRDNSKDDGISYKTLDYMVATGHSDFSVGADPSVHDPCRCGHLCNDYRGTGKRPNAAIMPFFGGIFTSISSLSPIREGEEVLIDYGEGYWRSRSKVFDERGTLVNVSLAVKNGEEVELKIELTPRSREVTSGGCDAD